MCLAHPWFRCVIATHAKAAYTSRPMRIQITIRSVPGSLEPTLRQGAKREGECPRTIAVETRARGRGIEVDGGPHNDLDALIGSWEEDPSFGVAVEGFGRIDGDAWK